jgi:hypothetical protein
MAIKVLYDFGMDGAGIKSPGWGETHILDADAPDLTTYFSKAIDLGNKRMGWAASNVRLHRFRVSRVGYPRQFEVYYSTTGGNKNSALLGVGQLTGKASDIPSTSLRVQLRNSSAKRGRLYAAGIPDDVIKTATIVAGVLSPTGPDLGAVDGFLNAYLGWRDKLISDQWCFRGTAQPVPVAINAWVQAAGAPFPLILQTSVPLAFPGGNPPNWPQNALLHVRNVRNAIKGTPTVNGRVRVADYATNGTTFSYTLLNTQGFQATDILANGTVEVVSYQQWPINSTTIEGQGSRKRGVGSLRLRGRLLRRRPSLV